ncbi:formate dehydrogenase accessory protein FdhE [Eoetvoesiella caeni]|uniref:Protein FdhE homolog n=1 Tax=Eoetvoesiella caeni TaxID=645616 RepID=A0A366HK17_9BURK|nr:formate dehydrogenase accessory protein FdhE [Eoetvoesiella caeni]MCI2808107.1 formate dehydrogenase accessory protein FdhE [Eoetvoesiella caeni]NYT53891.1 formate dehydrogenase accessory protein FdhE [Eoetvoesiella caeni]RBP42030.1 Tat proofreading chaperone FdhE [Eoetvoesiella caeni]
MQRILSRGEIESLDHTAIPRFGLPVRATVFADRAARLRHLAQDNPASAYLLLMAKLVDAQQRVLSGFSAPEAPAERLSLAQAHGMPPMQAIGWQRDPAWRGMLVAMLDHVAGAGVPEPAAKVCAQLKRLAHEDSAALETMADAVLAERDGEVDSAMAPFVMAALQVYWTDLAGRFDERQLPVVSPFGVCPVCASLPVASVVRIGGQRDGCRYLCCSLCSTQWHLVRVTCSHCEQTEGIAYHSIEGGPEGIKAESCDHCHTYRKIFYHDKDQYFEAVADDLATLPLDVLMGEEGYLRASANPLLWQHP